MSLGKPFLTSVFTIDSFLKVISQDKVTSSFTPRNNRKAAQVCLPGLKSTAILPPRSLAKQEK